MKYGNGRAILSRFIQKICLYLDKLCIHQHLHRYADEFGFLWDTRKQADMERMLASIQNCEGKRLMYRSSQ